MVLKKNLQTKRFYADKWRRNLKNTSCKYVNFIYKLCNKLTYASNINEKAKNFEN